MTGVELDMIQTAGIGALALLVGMVLTRKVAFLQRFCVPSPVSGGIIFSLITLLLEAIGNSLNERLAILGQFLTPTRGAIARTLHDGGR